MSAQLLHGMILWSIIFIFFFFNDTATTEIYTLSLHDALPISVILIASNSENHGEGRLAAKSSMRCSPTPSPNFGSSRSEEHTSELQSPCNLVCRLLLEKKKSSPSSC